MGTDIRQSYSIVFHRMGSDFSTSQRSQVNTKLPFSSGDSQVPEREVL